jgi:hypothetical protein
MSGIYTRFPFHPAILLARNLCGGKSREKKENKHLFENKKRFASEMYC